MKRAFVMAVTIVLLGPAAASAATWSVRSPDGELRATVTDEPFRLQVERAGRAVLSSDLGLTTAAGDVPVAFQGRSDRRIDDRYRTPAGKRREHRLRANEMTLASEAMTFEVRVADDGVAYRYVLPGPTEITGERSAFTAPGARAWLLPWRPNYENHFEATSLEAAPPRIYGFPALLSVGSDTWALISEAGDVGAYAASQMTAASGVLHITLPQPSVQAAETPWRVAVVGDLGTVVESDLTTDLGAPSRVGDQSWIRPGTVAWSWWSDGGSPRDFERQKDYVDYAASVGWPYVLVDEGWSPDWMPELVRYAARRGVRMFVWARWNDLETQAQRDALLPLWKSWGVAGVKADFMDSDTQERMRWYDAMARDTARLELLLNFHGSTPPRGIQRTWPHVLTLEGVRGAEDYNLGFLTPQHNATLPFTRNVIGSMDYTPVTFSADRRETSAGHELALSVVYESGLLHPADSVESYSGRGVAEAFLQRVPTAWDETRLVDGFPGRDATLARRRGRDWFVGAIAAGRPRTVDVPLSFLPPGRRYVAEVVDDVGHDELVVRRRLVTRRDRLRVRLSRNGGFAAAICPAACLDEARLSRLRVTTSRRFVAPGGTVTTRVTTTNRSRRALRDVRSRLQVPEGWSARLASRRRWASIPPGASRTARWIVTAAASDGVVRPEATATYRSGGRRMRRTAVGELTPVPGAPPSGTAHLSDLEPFNAFNASGPLELDMSNGGDQAGDGGPITIEGRTFAKGLGGHAHSEQAYYVGGACTRFEAVVGVDDEVGASGTVVFQVWADDRKVFDSGRRTGGQPGLRVSESLEGVEELKLVLGDSGDHTVDDHGDWADARVVCG